MEEDSEEYQEEMPEAMIQQTMNSRQMPIKQHIVHCESLLKDIWKDLHENRKAQQVIRTEFTQLEYVNKEECNNITEKVLDELDKLGRELKKIVNEEKNENLFLKQQIA